MLSDVQFLLSRTWELFGLPFTLYGFTFSFRDVFLWSIVGGLLLWFIGRLFNSD